MTRVLHLTEQILHSCIKYGLNSDNTFDETISICTCQKTGGSSLRNTLKIRVKILLRSYCYVKYVTNILQMLMMMMT